jgi:hypothetical protein
VHTIVEHYGHVSGRSSRQRLALYTCGHPGMIEDLRARYSGTGYTFEEERFWKALMYRSSRPRYSSVSGSGPRMTLASIHIVARGRCWHSPR